MKPKPHRVPMSLRLSPEMDRRLEQCADRLKVKKHSLAQAAIEAAVEAIEKNGYRLVFPMEFRLEVTQLPVPVPEPNSAKTWIGEVAAIAQRRFPKKKTDSPK